MRTVFATEASAERRRSARSGRFGRGGDARTNRGFAAHLDDENSFKSAHRVPSLSVDDALYSAKGEYWRGSVWPPTNYMVLRGLTAAGLDKLAAEIGRNHHKYVVETYLETGTVWENYAPAGVGRGSESKGDFVGWGGVGPIAVFLEYVIGLRPDVPGNRLVWDVTLTEAHGVKAYPFGADGVLDLGVARRKKATEKPQVEVTSKMSVTLEVRWGGGSETVEVSGAG